MRNSAGQMPAFISHSASCHFCVTQDGKIQGISPPRLFPSCELSLLRNAGRETGPAGSGEIFPVLRATSFAPRRMGNPPPWARRPEPRWGSLPRPLCPVSGTFLAFRRFRRAFRRFVAPGAFGFGFGGTMRPGSRFGPLSRASHLRLCRCRYRPWGVTSRKNQT